MINLVPTINSVGKFKLATPLNTFLNTDITYTVIGNRTISEMVDDGLNVLDHVYKVMSLTEEDYHNDLTNNIIISILKSESNDTFYIPTNKFVAIPDITGKRYVQKTIGVNLGYLPVDLDVEYLIPELTDLIASMLGVTPSATVLETSQITMYSDAEHDSFTATRTSNIANDETCIGKLIKIKAILKAMREKEIILVERLSNLTS